MPDLRKPSVQTLKSVVENEKNGPADEASPFVSQNCGF